jgi:hypothetical protein
MLFKSNNDYSPDAGCDDAEPEATAAEAAPAPQSEARQRLAKLLEQRDQANAAMGAARASIAKLAKAQGLAAPFEQQLAMIGEAESNALRLWSGDDGDATPPAPNVEAREGVIVESVPKRTLSRTEEFGARVS